MIGLPASLRRSLEPLEDELLEGRAITEGSILDAIAGFFEDHHSDVVPQVLSHGFVAVLPTALMPLFNDERLIEALALTPSEAPAQAQAQASVPAQEEAPASAHARAQHPAQDPALRLQFMTACVAEVLLAEPDELLVAGHLRCGLLALRVATCDAVLAMADDGEALIWAGIFPDHEAFEADLRARGYWLSLTDWESLPIDERLALWRA
jgi:hypothetical protein